MLVVGPNGAGKTNLLEALHVGDAGLLAADARGRRSSSASATDAARVALDGAATRELRRDARSTLAPRDGEAGAPERRRVAKRRSSFAPRLAALVFTPDRLAVVKGGPAVRRAYLDRVLGRVLPAARPISRPSTPRAVAQRNAALRRVGPAARVREVASRRGRSSWPRSAPSSTQPAPSTRRCARARRSRSAAAGSDSRTRVARVRGRGARPSRSSRSGSTATSSAARRGSAPTCDDVVDHRRRPRPAQLRLPGRAAHSPFWRCCWPRRSCSPSGAATPPLLLLDDVSRELDTARRRALLARLAARRTDVVTATHRAPALPPSPAQLVEVTPGEARAAA